jgi:hypothetical protein
VNGPAIVIPPAPRSWDSVLLDRPQATSLVGIARQGRLVRRVSGAALHVHLARVDEEALGLLEAALARRKSIVFLYPAPAGEVSVLLAAQVLLQRFQRGDESPSIGIVTADTVSAARAWESLYISTPGDRTPLTEVFPCWRATPDGLSPFGRHRFRGVLVGGRFADWPVDMVIVDGLAGSMPDDIRLPTVRVIADPLDPALPDAAARGELVWAWTQVDIARSVDDPGSGQRTSPFSVARDRLDAIAGGVDTTIRVVRNAEAGRLASRIRDDLRSLAEVIGTVRSPSIMLGMRIAWSHLATLTSLPCRPSDFDRFAGLPPFAARATSTFEKEIAAWARSLPDDPGDLASIVASDLADLRASLEVEPPFLEDLRRAAAGKIETLAVVRTHTAARGLTHALAERSDGDCVGSLVIRAIRRLHTEGSWPRAMVIGMPARWEWHRFDSGLSSDLQVLVLGDTEAERSRSTLQALHEARERWADRAHRSETWRMLMGGDVPVEPAGDGPRGSITIVGWTGGDVAADPFEQFEPLLLSVPLAIGDEGVEDAVAEEMEDGTWAAEVEAVDVETDLGRIKLEAEGSLEIRAGEKIVDRRAAQLQPGDVLLIGRREGRIGLLDVVAERLKRHRPDLYAAGLVISDLQASVRRAFRASGMTRTRLHRELVSLGFRKTYHATRGYVGDGGPLAPRDLADLERLNQALGLGLTDLRIQEMFAAVQRRRVFRRIAGKALAAAARGSTVAAESGRIDPETGLSLADLREVVLQATVVSVRKCPEPIALADLGRLEPRD